MKIKKISGKELQLSEEEYQMLLNRTDLKRVIKVKDDFGTYYYCIKEPCICKFYSDNCMDDLGDDCPFQVFAVKREDYGCIDLLFEILGDDSKHPSFNEDEISWSMEYDKEARKNIRKIRKALKSMKGVKNGK